MTSSRSPVVAAVLVAVTAGPGLLVSCSADDATSPEPPPQAEVSASTTHAPLLDRADEPEVIAFVDESSGGSAIWIRRRGERPVRLTPQGERDLDPAISPDGRFIAFRMVRGDNEVGVMRMDGTERRNLTNSAASEYSPAWSPDGETIAFATDRQDGANDIWLMDADGRNQRPLVSQEGIDEFPSWSPDGERIAFLCTGGRILPSRAGDFELCLVGADGTGLRQLTDDEGYKFGAAWSPDGSQVATTSVRGMTTIGAVWVVDASSGRRLAVLLEGSGLASSWAPSGDRVGVIMATGDSWDIHVMPASGGTPRRLGLDGFRVVAASWRW